MKMIAVKLNREKDIYEFSEIRIADIAGKIELVDPRAEPDQEFIWTYNILDSDSNKIGKIIELKGANYKLYFDSKDGFFGFLDYLEIEKNAKMTNYAELVDNVLKNISF